MADQKPLLQFPTDYPIKIVGRPSDEFRARVHALMVRHVPDLDTEKMSERKRQFPVDLLRDPGAEQRAGHQPGQRPEGLRRRPDDPLDSRQRPCNRFITALQRPPGRTRRASQRPVQ